MKLRNISLLAKAIIAPAFITILTIILMYAFNISISDNLTEKEYTLFNNIIMVPVIMYFALFGTAVSFWRFVAYSLGASALSFIPLFLLLTLSAELHPMDEILVAQIFHFLGWVSIYWFYANKQEKAERLKLDAEGRQREIETLELLRKQASK